jgi:all-trans-retinol dehydrogenase (NAD+)
MRKIIDLVYDVAMIFYYVIKAILVPWIPIKYRSKDISGQIALVTGAGGGIGRLLAVGLSKEGCKVVCWDVAKQGSIRLHNLRIVVVVDNNFVFVWLIIS